MAHNDRSPSPAAPGRARRDPKYRARLRHGLALLTLCGLCGCLDGRYAPGEEVDAGDPNPSRTRVEVGLPDPETGTGFVPLQAGGEVAVQTFGQGGNHVEVSIACTGFGNAIFPQVAIEALDGEGAVETAPYVRPQPVACDDDGRCIDSKVFVMLGGLAPPDALDGLRVRITALVSNEAGLMGEGSVEAVLRML